jgi:hypothetical protein
MNDPAAVVIAVVVFTSATAAIKIIASAVLRLQENRLKHANPAGNALGTATDARLERMEQAIDSIAIEIERISEGQRFTTKLLSERSASVR